MLSPESPCHGLSVGTGVRLGGYWHKAQLGTLSAVFSSCQLQRFQRPAVGSFCEWCDDARGGFLKWGYPKSSKSLDHSKVLKPMVTWGSMEIPHFQKPWWSSAHGSHCSWSWFLQLNSCYGPMPSKQVLQLWHIHMQKPCLRYFSPMASYRKVRHFCLWFRRLLVARWTGPLVDDRGCGATCDELVCVVGNWTGAFSAFQSPGRHLLDADFVVTAWDFGPELQPMKLKQRLLHLSQFSVRYKSWRRSWLFARVFIRF